MTTLSEQVTQKIQANGGRLTSQRLAILDALEALSGHPTAEEIYLFVQQIDSSINLSTVYRNLRWLEENGLINPRLFADDRGQQRFDSAGPEDHYHFRCSGCNTIVEFEAPLLETIKERFEGDLGARVTSSTLIFYGLCRQCQSQEGT